MRKILNLLESIKWIHIIILIIAGIINSVGVILLLSPLNLLDSGISGTALFLDRVTPPYMVMSIFLIVLNVPFYILGIKKLGKEFIAYSLLAIGVYSLFSYLFKSVLPIDFSNGSPFTGNDVLLSAIFGGLLSGIGSGLVIRMGGAIDGVEVMAVLFAKKLGLSVGTFVMIYNVILYITYAVVFNNWIISLYSIITYAVGIKTVDFIVEGIDKAKAIFIVAKKDTNIQSVLSEKLGRGVTMIEAKGYYSNESKIFLYCVVNRFEISRVKKLVHNTDKTAFVTICDVTETIGSNSNLSFEFKVGKPRKIKLHKKPASKVKTNNVTEIKDTSETIN